LLRNNLRCHSLTSASKFFNRMHTDTVRATGLRVWPGLQVTPSV
jgi:hypothetical protein